MARKDPIEKLSLRHDVAVRQFLDAADELDEVAHELADHALQADRAAEAALLRAATARSQSHDAARRAGRIRELLG